MVLFLLQIDWSKSFVFRVPFFDLGLLLDPLVQKLKYYIVMDENLKNKATPHVFGRISCSNIIVISKQNKKQQAVNYVIWIGYITDR